MPGLNKMEQAQDQVELIRLSMGNRPMSPLARQELVRSCQPLVVFFTKKHLREGVDLQDLIQQGNLGLMKAAEKFDPNNGASFASYARIWINQYMYKWVNDTFTDLRLPLGKRNLLNHIKELQGIGLSITEIAKFFEITEEKVLNVLAHDSRLVSLDAPGTSNPDSPKLEGLIDSGLETPEDAVFAAQQVAIANGLIDGLLQPQRELVERCYGMNGNAPTKLATIAAEQGVTRAAISARLKKILAQLRQAGVNSPL